MVGIVLSGCSADPEAEAPSATTTSSQATRDGIPAKVEPPILFLNITLGNVTVAFGSDLAANATSGPVNGTAPLEVSFALAASRIPAGPLEWTLDLGAANGTTPANETAPRNGTTLPATVDHTYVAEGTFNITFTLKAGNASVQRVDAILRIAAGNATVATRPVVVLFQTQFSGSLPLDGATVANHPFAVPVGGIRILYVYTSDHVGLFSAVAVLNDPSGTQKIDSLTECGANLNAGVASDQCAMVLEEELAPGDWAAEVDYQAGQVIEDYTLDITVLGYA
ncbi:MAG: hypothetical protein ACYC2H_01680 [Thermoplasmatota archaeon]